MKKLAIFFALLFCVALAGSIILLSLQPSKSRGSEPTQDPSGTISTPPVEEPTQPASPADEPATPTPAEGEQTATLYIGTRARGFAEYPMTYEGELTPEMLIQGIADLTGWNLTLAEPVTSGKGGMSVCLSSESSLFTGPPDPQREEFHMYDVGQLAETILDSIQKTLQKGFVLEPGDPDMLDIWYYMEGTRPLELPNLGLSWPIDQPYQWTAGQNEKEEKP